MLTFVRGWLGKSDWLPLQCLLWIPVLAENCPFFFFYWGQWTGSAHEKWSCKVDLQWKTLHICKSLAPADLIAPTQRRTKRGKRRELFMEPNTADLSCLLSVMLCFTFVIAFILCYPPFFTPCSDFSSALYLSISYSVCSSPSGCRCSRQTTHTFTLFEYLNTHYSAAISN